MGTLDGQPVSITIVLFTRSLLMACHSQIVHWQHVEEAVIILAHILVWTSYAARLRQRPGKLHERASIKVYSNLYASDVVPRLLGFPVRDTPSQ